MWRAKDSNIGHTLYEFLKIEAQTYLNFCNGRIAWSVFVVRVELRRKCLFRYFDPTAWACMAWHQMLSDHGSNSDALENGHLEIEMFDLGFGPAFQISTG